MGDKAPTHILYVITDLQVGGVPLHLLRLARAMVQRGFRATVVSLARPGPVGEQLEAQGIEVLTCNGRGGWDFRVLPRLTAIVRDGHPDVIHAFLFHANIASRWAVRRAGLPPERLLCEIQTVEIERPWHLWLERLTCRTSRCTIGNSPSVIEHLATRAKVPRDRLVLIRGGIDPAPLRNAEALPRDQLHLAPDSRIILWAGRLDPIKGLHLLVDAFAPIAARFDAFLLLAGGPLQGRTYRQIQRRVTARRLNDRVHLLGPRNDVPALLKLADVFVFPSRTEGLPNALLEAMAAGRPIVTTDVPGCRDLIEHERNGLLVPYGDTAALAAILTRLLEDPGRAARLARAAADDAEHHWHLHHTLDAYEALYRHPPPPARRSPTQPRRGGGNAPRAERAITPHG